MAAISSVSSNAPDPPLFVAVTVYTAAEAAAEGVPVMAPVAASSARPAGSAGLTANGGACSRPVAARDGPSTVYPKTAPPVAVGAVGAIASPTTYAWGSVALSCQKKRPRIS